MEAWWLQWPAAGARARRQGPPASWHLTWLPPQRHTKRVGEKKLLLLEDAIFTQRWPPDGGVPASSPHHRTAMLQREAGLGGPGAAATSQSAMGGAAALCRHAAGGCSKQYLR